MKIEASAVDGLPALVPGDQLADLILANTNLDHGDVVVVAQKAISKIEDRFADPRSVEPSARALELAAQTDKEPGLVELILRESAAVLRAAPGVLIVETHHGFICANAGIDSSNLDGSDAVLLLPIDPDESARTLRARLQRASEKRIAVVVTDSFGRAWRSGQCDVAIGCAGIDPLLDLRGTQDRGGRELAASIQAVGDELAAAADLAREKASGQPVVIVRGRPDLVISDHGPGAVSSLRERSQDLFR